MEIILILLVIINTLLFIFFLIKFNKTNEILIDNNDNLLEIIHKLELIRNNTYISAKDTKVFKKYQNNKQDDNIF